MPSLTKAVLEDALANTPCENRNMGGFAAAHINTCQDFAAYLKSCGIEWCVPCQVRQLPRYAKKEANSAASR